MLIDESARCVVPAEDSMPGLQESLRKSSWSVCVPHQGVGGQNSFGGCKRPQVIVGRIPGAALGVS